MKHTISKMPFFFFFTNMNRKAEQALLRGWYQWEGGGIQGMGVGG
jgi:hypothetical protein